MALKIWNAYRLKTPSNFSHPRIVVLVAMLVCLCNIIEAFTDKKGDVIFDAVRKLRIREEEELFIVNVWKLTNSSEFVNQTVWFEKVDTLLKNFEWNVLRIMGTNRRQQVKVKTGRTISPLLRVVIYSIVILVLIISVAFLMKLPSSRPRVPPICVLARFRNIRGN